MATAVNVPRVDKAYLVIGRSAADDLVFPRLEIRDLQEKPEQLTLFLHSLDAIMLPEHRPKASRFVDLAGIHGLPYERWAGDPAVDDDAPPVGTNGGYCYHGSALFPMWHRPYLLAIEQSIGEVATRLARVWTRNLSASEQTKWAKAAEELRLPFWDWTNLDYAKNGLPDIFQTQTYTFKIPGRDQPTTIDNPLASFYFGERHPDGFENFIWKTPLASQGMSFFKDWQRTYRWPTSKLYPTDDYIQIKEKLAGTENERGSCLQLRNAVCKLFCYPLTVDKDQESTTWDEFSNTTFQSKGKTTWMPHNLGSIESPHNSVHLLLGGLGALAENDYAGFDPIFYLHHCNVDRILAFWEHVYPSHWMGDGYKNKEGDVVPFTQSGGTWAADESDNITAATALQPFRKFDNTYWNSTDTRYKGGHGIPNGYTYPPIVLAPGQVVSLDTHFPLDGPDFTENLRERQRYIGILQRHFANEDTFSGGITGRLVHPLFNTATKSPPSQYVMIRGYRHFTVQVQLVGHAFNGSYWLQLLCGEKVIGSFAVLTRGEGTHCAACVARHNAGGKVRGIIDIPEDVIFPIFEKIGQKDPSTGTDSDRLIQSCKKYFSARIVGPSDVLLAEVAESKHRVMLESSIVPKLVLLSAAAAQPEGQDTKAPSGPIQLFDWKDHGEIISNGKWTLI